MNTTAMLLKQLIPDSVKPIIRRQLGIGRGHQFLVAHSIVEQTVCFIYGNRRFTITADGSTPLYETIAEVVDYDCYQLSAVQWPAQPGYIVDIGANIGVSALVLSQFPCRRTICFEPLPSNCLALKSTLELNSITNVDVIPRAVSDIHGPAWFRASEDSVGGKLISASPQNGCHQNEMLVTCIRLDEVLALCHGYDIALMKVDCEGGEYAIVDQMTPQAARHILNITFEIHLVDASRNLRSISAILRKLGYKLHFKADVFDRAHLGHLLAVRSQES